jgi:spermidine/putrescine transport system substrate-binding protein
VVPVIGGFGLMICAGCKEEAQNGSSEKPGETLAINIWEDFIPESVLKEFEQETGITIKAEYFTKLDVLAAQVRADPARFDLISPTDYLVEQLGKEGLLAPIDSLTKTLAPRLEARYRQPWWDPELKYCAPLQRSVSGLAYNKKFIKEPPRKWADLFDPKKAKAWSGRMTMLDDARETLGIALLGLGRDPGSDQTADFEAAAASLRGVLPMITKFDSEKYEDLLASGAVWVAHGWNGDLARAQERNPDIAYIIPEEGTLVSVDSLCICAGAKNRSAAKRFIEFMLRPATACKTMREQGLPSCVEVRSHERLALKLNEETVFGLPPDEKTYRFKAAGPEAAEREKIWKQAKEF